MTPSTDFAIEPVIQREAETAEGDHPGRAEVIYMGLTESLGVHYNRMDDSSGDLWPLFEECVEATGRCIRRQDLTAEDRRWHIEYLAGWSLVVFSDFMKCYERELERLCADVDDLNVWMRVLEMEAAGGEDRVLLGGQHERDSRSAGPRAGESGESRGGGPRPMIVASRRAYRA